ncbi:MAG: hypothetical protein MI922_20200, partial [Bacteroidales bacterium]|nr:hypothetical protein [Bacteroidales bacterium]
MTLLKTLPENEATGVAKVVYDGFKQQFGKIPNIIKFHTASTYTFETFMSLIQLFAEHSKLDRVLISYLRLILSRKYGGNYCVSFQSFINKAHGESDENIQQALDDVTKLNMDEKRKSLLLFTIELLEGTNANIKNQLEQLHLLGWDDKEIYEFCL